MIDARDRWQRNAVDKFVSSSKDFLITACPGAGKTRAALMAARTLMDQGVVNRVVIVAPTKAVRSQWAKEAQGFGLDLTERYRNGDGALPADVDGVACVYQQIASSPGEWRILTSRKHRSLVILDEIHHAADDDHTSWGPALRQAFGDAERRLLLSGTPFRTDRGAIPFVTYDDAGNALSDHGLNYGSAVMAGIVRPIRFEVFDGEGVWLRGSQRMQARATSVNEQDESALLRSLYASDGKWIESVMRRADEELTRVREEMPNAGGLVIALDKEHARKYANLMQSICGELVEVVMSDDDEADAEPYKIIQRFRQGTSRWIVAVAMISEGVDIPRLAVSVFASAKRTEMWFRQVAGRVVRTNGDAITATMFIPAIGKLVDMAERIEEEAESALREAERRIRDQLGQQSLDVGEFVQPLASSDALLTFVVTRGDTIPDAELQLAIQLRDRVGGSVSMSHPADIARLLREGGATYSQPEPSAPKAEPVSGDQLRTNLRKQVNFEVNRLCRDKGLTQQQVHGHLNQMLGDTVPTASKETLEKRLVEIRAWF